VQFDDTPADAGVHAVYYVYTMPSSARWW